MKFQATGIITFEDGLELKDPFMEISKVNYDFIANTFSLELLFAELHHRHSRTFNNPAVITGLVTTADVLAFIENNSFLAQFTLVL